MKRRWSFSPPSPPDEAVAIVRALLTDERALILAMARPEQDVRAVAPRVPAPGKAAA